MSKAPRTPEYQSWLFMRQRCTNPNRSQYHHYGGRGIKVHPPWNTFATFLADMGPRPAGTCLDRIDVDGDYTPSNCRWAPKADQSRNRRDTIYIEFRGETKRLKVWCEELNLSYNLVYQRLYRDGLTITEALTR